MFISIQIKNNEIISCSSCPVEFVNPFDQYLVAEIDADYDNYIATTLELEVFKQTFQLVNGLLQSSEFNIIRQEINPNYVEPTDTPVTSTGLEQV